MIPSINDAISSINDIISSVNEDELVIPHRSPQKGFGVVEVRKTAKNHVLDEGNTFARAPYGGKVGLMAGPGLW